MQTSPMQSRYARACWMSAAVCVGRVVASLRSALCLLQYSGAEQAVALFGRDDTGGNPHVSGHSMDFVLRPGEKLHVFPILW